MIYNDAWTEGLTNKQQNLVVEFVLNSCEIKPGMAGYKTITPIKKFLDSSKGRKAVIKYVDFKFDIKKPHVKMELMKMHFIRAFFNPADIITPDGEFVNNIDSLRQLGDLAYCIDGVESEVITSVSEKSERIVTKKKIKICDRNKSLQVIQDLFKIGGEEEEIDIDEKSIFEMSDEERQEEIKRLLEKQPGIIREAMKMIEDARKEGK